MTKIEAFLYVLQKMRQGKKILTVEGRGALTDAAVPDTWEDNRIFDVYVGSVLNGLDAPL